MQKRKHRKVRREIMKSLTKAAPLKFEQERDLSNIQETELMRIDEIYTDFTNQAKTFC